MNPTLINNFFIQHILSWFATIVLFFTGWQVKGRVPEVEKFVLIAAPHSSNWDFVYFLLAVFKFKISAHWMGKHTLFKWPFRHLLKRLGGIPVNRTRKSDVVKSMATAFEKSSRLILTIAPSGTRGRTLSWKTGFYHIACQANIPIVFGFIDYMKKHVGIGPVFHPCGNYEADLKSIKSYYSNFSGKYTLVETSNSDQRAVR